jgi:hypothetical protein
MTEEPKDLPLIVYKYRNWKDEFHKDILLKNSVWLSSPKDLNDPFDCKISVCYDLLDTRDKILAYAIKKVGEHSVRLIHENRNLEQEIATIVYRLTHQRAQLQQIHNEFDIESLNNHFGILSLSTCWDETTMWAYYADANKGYCVGLWEEKLENGLFGGGGKVIYDDYPKIDPMKDNDIELMYSKLHYKSKAWEREREYRLTKMFYPNIATKADRTITIPDDYFAEVILGLNVKRETEEEIINIALKKSIKVYKIMQKPFDYGLDRKEIC